MLSCILDARFFFCWSFFCCVLVLSIIVFPPLFLCSENIPMRSHGPHQVPECCRARFSLVYHRFNLCSYVLLLALPTRGCAYSCPFCFCLFTSPKKLRFPLANPNPSFPSPHLRTYPRPSLLPPSPPCHCVIELPHGNDSYLISTLTHLPKDYQRAMLETRYNLCHQYLKGPTLQVSGGVCVCLVPLIATPSCKYTRATPFGQILSCTWA